jgi:ribonuclease VapC
MIVAILGREADREDQFSRVQVRATTYHFNALVRFESAIALAPLTQAAKAERTTEASITLAEAIFDDFMSAISTEEIGLSSEIGRGAIAAADTYGKMVGHKAALNLGDCFSCAAAKSSGTKLL